MSDVPGEDGLIVIPVSLQQTGLISYEAAVDGNPVLHVKTVKPAGSGWTVRALRHPYLAASRRCVDAVLQVFKGICPG